MQNLRRTTLALMLLGGLGAGSARPTPAPVRLISASISVDGATVLRASTSDDGAPDVDAVWGYLSEALVFEPTEAFAELDLDPEVDRHTLGWLRGRATAHLGEPPALALEVRYGGSDTPHLLTLLRAEDGARWRVAPETIEGRFGHRRITRNQARALDDPTRER